jgi:hypothetical protein
VTQFSDGWPDAGDFPDKGLIRIRYVHEIDLVALQVVQRAIRSALPRTVAAEINKHIISEAVRIVRAAAESKIPLLEDPDALRRHAALKTLLQDRDLYQPSPVPWRYGASSSGYYRPDPDGELCPRPHWPWPPQWRWNERWNELPELLKEQLEQIKPDPTPWRETVRVEDVQVLAKSLAVLKLLSADDIQGIVSEQVNMELDALAEHTRRSDSVGDPALRR